MATSIQWLERTIYLGQLNSASKTPHAHPHLSLACPIPCLQMEWGLHPSWGPGMGSQESQSAPGRALDNDPQERNMVLCAQHTRILQSVCHMYREHTCYVCIICSVSVHTCLVSMAHSTKYRGPAKPGSAVPVLIPQPYSQQLGCPV